MKKYRAGIIGLGRIGFTLGFDKKREKPSSHSDAFGRNRRILLDGGFDINPEKRKLWGKYYKRASVYSSAAEMLSDGKWDILVIAVPEEFHLAVFKKAVKAIPGVIVLEKPVAPAINDARAIKQEAENLGVPVLVNHERRFSRDYITMKRIITGGKLGEPVNIVSSLYTPSRAWKYGDEIFGKGALVRDGTHLFDAVNFLLGERPVIHYVKATGVKKKGNIAGITCLGQAAGVDAVFNIGFKADHFTFEIDLICKTGRIRIGNGMFEVSAAKISPFYGGFYSLIKDPRFKAFRKTGGFSGMAANCVEFLDGKSLLLSTLDDGIDALLTIEEIKGFLKEQGIKLY